MKQPAASPGRAEKQLPAPPGLARLLLSKSRRGARSRRVPATSPMFVSRGRSAGRGAAADGEPSSPKVTCIGQVRMRKGKGKKGAVAPAKASTPEKARGYCRCLKKAFLCGGLFDFDRRRRHKAPSQEVERSRRSPWVFSSRDVAVAAAPKPPDPRRERCEEEEEDEMEVGVGVFGSVERDDAEELGISGGGDKEEKEEAAELVSSATTTPPKNALLLMRCRSAPQNRSSPLTSRFPGAAPLPSPTHDTVAFAVEIAATPRASPSPRKAQMAAVEREDEQWQEVVAAQEHEEEVGEEEEDEDEDDDDEEEEEEEEEEEMRCSSARPLVLPRCKSEPATTAAAKMAAGTGAEATSSGCFWANGGSSGRRRHAPPPAAAAPVALTGH